jgi:hypothetical protein
LGAAGLLMLAALGLVIWIWRNSLSIRETAIRAARETCRRQGLQFLDETVVLKRMSLDRNLAGWMAVRRVFEFSYSETGLERNAGFVIMLGPRIEQVGL